MRPTRRSLALGFVTIALLAFAPLAEAPSAAPGASETVVRGGLLDFTALTLFGDQSLGRCKVDLQMRVDRDGAVTISDVEIVKRSLDSSVPGQAACGDLHPCGRSLNAPEEAPTLPWHGRLRDPAGRPRNVIELDFCLDTCLGRFEGPVTLPLTTGPGRRVRLRARRARVGVSGLELSGDLPLRPVGR
jgi:hypothetical protein